MWLVGLLACVLLQGEDLDDLEAAFSAGGTGDPGTTGTTGATGTTDTATTTGTEGTTGTTDTDPGRTETGPGFDVDWSSEPGDRVLLGLFSAEASTGDLEGLTEVWTTRESPVLPAASPVEVEDLGDGLFGKIYSLVAFEDVDGNGEWSVGESLVGWSRVFPFFIEGDPGELAGAGFGSGWNLMEAQSDGEARWHSFTDPVRLSLLDEQAEVSLTGGEVKGHEADEAALVSSLLFEGADAEPLTDGHNPTSWQMTVAGSPPDDHLLDDDVVVYALELPLSYRDLDGSATFTSGDQAVALACQGGDVVAMIWIEPPDDLLSDWLGFSTNFVPGWSAVRLTEGPGEPISKDPALFDPSCGT